MTGGGCSGRRHFLHSSTRWPASQSRKAPGGFWAHGDQEKHAQAIAILGRIEPHASSQQLQATAARIVEATRSNELLAGGSISTSLADLRRPILLAFLIAFFNQLSGINAILYFAPRIFEMAGLGEKSGAASVNRHWCHQPHFNICWVVAHRPPWEANAHDYRINWLYRIAWTMRMGVRDWPRCDRAGVHLRLYCAHAVGQGAVIWVFIAEIFPGRFRATGQAIGCTTHWVLAALLTTIFPSLVVLVPPSGVFAFFCGMMVLQLLWVLTMMPETKGVPLEELAKRLRLNRRTAASWAEWNMGKPHS